MKFTGTLTVGLMLGTVLTHASAQSSDVAQKQKSIAESRFAKVHTGKASFADTSHFHLIGVLPEAKLKPLAASMEKTYQIAAKALEFDDKSPPWPGKLTVFVLADPTEVRSLIRLAQKRSPRANETMASEFKGDAPYIAVCQASGKEAATIEANSNQELASGLLQAKAKEVILPDWILTGFAKATIVQGSGLSGRKRQMARLALPVSTAWNDQAASEARSLVATSAAEFLFYGKGEKVSRLIASFRPSEGQMERTTYDALRELDTTPEQLDSRWKQWLLRP